MEENPYQSPEPVPEREKRPAKPANPYRSVAKIASNVLAFLMILLALLAFFGPGTGIGTPPSHLTTADILRIVAVYAVLAVVILWIIRRIA